MGRDWIGMIRRGVKKPPRYILQRVMHEIRGQAERRAAPSRSRRLSAAVLAKRAGYSTAADWWNALARRAYVAPLDIAMQDVECITPGDGARIIAAARRALAREVNLLGSGPVRLGSRIDWHRDYKSGHRWPLAYCRDIDYNNPDLPSDVKFPWELSRMQWMIPLGQAYLLTRDESYAHAARELIEDWIEANPYARSVNWACTMDVALRILSWTWFFHAFKHSHAWTDGRFRERFLQSLYLHGDFTARHLEKSDVNGNHYTADAAGLVFAGLFFGDDTASRRWSELGWSILRDEMPRQVFPDGVDFEASVPYHRLVQELFLLPAIYRLQHGLEVPRPYRERLVAMARFTAAYSRHDGSVPLWGDADDARALPFGGQGVNDHRYLIGIVGQCFGVPDLVAGFSGPRSEALWLLGAERTASLPDRPVLDRECESAAFPEGGFYVLRNRSDHVFVDCGPLGLAGRGGHGHNDLLSFEAALDGVHLVTDCGAYLYTASYRERNLFRSTAYHNTPKVDDQEINRFMRWDYLWFLHNDASHEVRLIDFQSGRSDRLVVSHGGYRRLSSPVTPVRTFTLDHAAHRLTVHDHFEGEGTHRIEIPLHLAPGVEVNEKGEGFVRISARGRQFRIVWEECADWSFDIEAGRVSPSYGIVYPADVLFWRRSGPLRPLTVRIERAHAVPSGE